MQVEKFCKNIRRIATCPCLLTEDAMSIQRAARVIELLFEIIKTEEEIIADQKEQIYVLEERYAIMTEGENNNVLPEMSMPEDLREDYC